MSEPPNLADLRKEIDRIDAEMHALLIERGQVIDRLIEIKTRQGGGSAFRPAREASMMRAIVKRHRGRLPVDTVESIWRVIISTFTYIQAPYSVHIDVSRGDTGMRDLARFHFGFTVPCVPHLGAGAVIGAVGASDGDLGMFALDGSPGAGAWWTSACAVGSPKDYRSIAVRGARGSPRGHARFRHLETVARWSRARCGAGIGHA